MIGDRNPRGCNVLDAKGLEAAGGARGVSPKAARRVKGIAIGVRAGEDSSKERIGTLKLLKHPNVQAFYLAIDARIAVVPPQALGSGRTKMENHILTHINLKPVFGKQNERYGIPKAKNCQRLEQEALPAMIDGVSANCTAKEFTRILRHDGLAKHTIKAEKSQEPLWFAPAQFFQTRGSMMAVCPAIQYGGLYESGRLEDASFHRSNWYSKISRWVLSCL
nr:hypothetical protein Iba_chr13cCG4150 [Ipomoea batatas]